MKTSAWNLTPQAYALVSVCESTERTWQQDKKESPTSLGSVLPLILKLLLCQLESVGYYIFIYAFNLPGEFFYLYGTSTFQNNL